MKNKEIMDSLIKEIDEIKQKPFSREEVVILSRNEKIAIDNKILCLQEENKKLKKVIEILKEEFSVEFDDEFWINILLIESGFGVGACFGKNKRDEYNLLKEVFGNAKD